METSAGADDQMVELHVVAWECTSQKVHTVTGHRNTRPSRRYVRYKVQVR